MSSKRKILQAVERERPVPHGRELVLTFRTDAGDPIPALLLLPEGSGRAPATLLVHGASSRKEEMAGALGRALLARGIASLAIDLPLHGTRADPVQAQTARNPLAMMQLWRQSLADVRLGVAYLAARPDLDASSLAILGYSLGSYLSIEIAAEEPRIKAVVLAAGGDLPEGTPFTLMARVASDPLRAVRGLRGRPLLMVHGRRDRTVLPEQAERLFAAAGEPKELRWFDAGHRLPEPASAEVALWLAERLGAGSARHTG